VVVFEVVFVSSSMRSIVEADDELLGPGVDISKHFS
jgi:hypothetical protein